MNIFFDVIISVLLILGGVFSLIGNYGLIKLKGGMQRLHAPTIVATFAIGTILIASIIYYTVLRQEFSWHELLILIFLFLSAPIIANFVAKVRMHLNVKEKNIPRPSEKTKWAVFSTPSKNHKNHDPQ